MRTEGDDRKNVHLENMKSGVSNFTRMILVGTEIYMLMVDLRGSAATNVASVPILADSS